MLILDKDSMAALYNEKCDKCGPPFMNMSSGSISLFSPISDMFKSKIHTTDVTTSALNTVRGGAGSNASVAVAAFIHPENGFLVYNVFVLKWQSIV